MALAIQRSLLLNFIQSMFDEGVVNDEFYQLLAMKDTIGQDYVVRAITSYCLYAQNLFSHLSYHISQPEVDYRQVDASAREFYARTSSIGAEHVKLSCAELIKACPENDKEYCSRALYWTKNEYSKLRRKFETLVQGILNDRFSHIQTLKFEEPDFVEQLINTYCIDVEAILSELTICINLSHVDFSQLAVLARQVEDRSSGIGAEHVRLACADLIQACDQMHMKNFSHALSWIKYEFARTRNKLQAVAKMEQRIIRLVTKQQEQ